MKKYPSYKEPKPLDADLTELEAAYIVELVDNHCEPNLLYNASNVLLCLHHCDGSRVWQPNRT